MKKILALLSLSMAVASSAWAANDDAKQQEKFAKIKQVRADGVQGRISIMQSALSCINAASNHDQMMSCDEKERQAMESLQQQQKAKWEAVRPKK